MAVVLIEREVDYNPFIDPVTGELVQNATSYHSIDPGADVSIINRVWDTSLLQYVKWSTAFVDLTGQRYPRGAAAFASDAIFYEVYSITFSRPQ